MHSEGLVKFVQWLLYYVGQQEVYLYDSAALDLSLRRTAPLFIFTEYSEGYAFCANGCVRMQCTCGCQRKEMCTCTQVNGAG